MLPIPINEEDLSGSVGIDTSHQAVSSFFICSILQKVIGKILLSKWYEISAVPSCWRADFLAVSFALPYHDWNLGTRERVSINHRNSNQINMAMFEKCLYHFLKSSNDFLLFLKASCFHITHTTILMINPIKKLTHNPPKIVVAKVIQKTIDASKYSLAHNR